MSTSLVHVLTIIGEAAREAEAACEELLSRRTPCDDGSYGTDDWMESDHRAIEALCRSLVGRATALPIVYYAQYFDAWTIADSTLTLLEWPDGQQRRICGADFGVAFYPSQYREVFLSQIAKYRRRRMYRTQSEDRWYLDHVYEALFAMDQVESRSVVISISHHHGPSRSGDEFLAALKSSIGLIQELPNEPK